MGEDIRKHVQWIVNQIRASHGLPPLHLHELESHACKKHAESMARDMEEHGFIFHSAERDRRGWRENMHYAWGDDHPYQLVEKMLWQPDEAHLRPMLEAREHIAADVAIRSTGHHRMPHAFLCMRFK